MALPSVVPMASKDDSVMIQKLRSRLSDASLPTSTLLPTHTLSTKSIPLSTPTLSPTNKLPIGMRRSRIVREEDSDRFQNALNDLPPISKSTPGSPRPTISMPIIKSPDLNERDITDMRMSQEVTSMLEPLPMSVPTAASRASIAEAEAELEAEASSKIAEMMRPVVPRAMGLGMLDSGIPDIGTAYEPMPRSSGPRVVGRGRRLVGSNSALPDIVTPTPVPTIDRAALDGDDPKSGMIMRRRPKKTLHKRWLSPVLSSSVNLPSIQSVMDAVKPTISSFESDGGLFPRSIGDDKQSLPLDPDQFEDADPSGTPSSLSLPPLITPAPEFTGLGLGLADMGSSVLSSVSKPEIGSLFARRAEADDPDDMELPSLSAVNGTASAPSLMRNSSSLRIALAKKTMQSATATSAPVLPEEDVAPAVDPEFDTMNTDVPLIPITISETETYSSPCLSSSMAFASAPSSPALGTPMLIATPLSPSGSDASPWGSPVPPAEAQFTSSPNPDNTSSNHESLVVGASVAGGVALLTFLTAMVWWYIKKRERPGQRGISSASIKHLHRGNGNNGQDEEKSNRISASPSVTLSEQFWSAHQTPILDYSPKNGMQTDKWGMTGSNDEKLMDGASSTRSTHASMSSCYTTSDCSSFETDMDSQETAETSHDLHSLGAKNAARPRSHSFAKSGTGSLRSLKDTLAAIDGETQEIEVQVEVEEQEDEAHADAMEAGQMEDIQDLNPPTKPLRSSLRPLTQLLYSRDLAFLPEIVDKDVDMPPRAPSILVTDHPQALVPPPTPPAPVASRSRTTSISTIGSRKRLSLATLASQYESAHPRFSEFYRTGMFAAQSTHTLPGEARDDASVVDPVYSDSEYAEDVPTSPAYYQSMPRDKEDDLRTNRAASSIFSVDSYDQAARHSSRLSGLYADAMGALKQLPAGTSMSTLQGSFEDGDSIYYRNDALVSAFPVPPPSPTIPTFGSQVADLGDISSGMIGHSWEDQVPAKESHKRTTSGKKANSRRASIARDLAASVSFPSERDISSRSSCISSTGRSASASSFEEAMIETAVRTQKTAVQSIIMPSTVGTAEDGVSDIWERAKARVRARGMSVSQKV